MRKNIIKNSLALLATTSFVVASTASAAPVNQAIHSAPVVQSDPFMVLSLANGATGALQACAAAAAAAAGQPAGGCVLPQTDVPPVAPATAVAPVVPVAAVAGAPLGISSLLLGVLALAAGIGLYAATAGHSSSRSISPA